MLFYIDSKSFIKRFLNDESDQYILSANYVLVSNYITVKMSQDNIIQASILFPDPEVFSALDDDVMRDRYYKQLTKDSIRGFLASVIKACIIDDLDVYFMCNKPEMKLRYLLRLSIFVEEYFGYPMYEYNLYKAGYYKIKPYNRNKVLKRCFDIEKEVKKNQKKKMLSTYSGKAKYLESIKHDKKKMKKILKKKGYDTSKMSKEDMIEILQDEL